MHNKIIILYIYIHSFDFGRVHRKADLLSPKGGLKRLTIWFAEIFQRGLHILLNFAWLVSCSLVVLAADIQFEARVAVHIHCTKCSIQKRLCQTILCDLHAKLKWRVASFWSPPGNLHYTLICHLQAHVK